MNSSSTRAENLEPTTETSNTANTYLTPGYGSWAIGTVTRGIRRQHPETLTAALAKAVLCLNQQPRRVCCIGWTVAFDKRILNLPLDQVDHYPFLRWTIQQTIPDLKLAKSVDEGHATQKPIEMTATRQPTIQHRYRSCRLR
ncbi:hypothetical protein NXS19_010437 [Fusarium pseudograminearum]|nr:hypothetical protein NXS19_010437 [Fusarium pseudograminearum]